MKSKGLIMNKITVLFLLLIYYPVFICASVIKPGVLLNIQVQSHPEFSGKFEVDSNGTIDYPLLADEHILDMSTSELMNELTYRLARYIENPLVIISVKEKPEITVTLLGNIPNPGPIKIRPNASIQEAIQSAGGLPKEIDLERIKIIHQGISARTTEYFNLKSFLKNGKLETMPKLQPNDIIILLSETHKKRIKVIGAVNKPGFYDLEEKLNVFELIYMAGGPAEKANLSRVRRFSKSNDKTIEEVLDIQSYIDKGKMDEIPFVQEGDVIIVYSRWFDWKIFMSILSNVLLFIVTIQSIKGAF